MYKLHFKDEYVCDPHNVATELTLIEKNLACSTEGWDALLVEMRKEFETKDAEVTEAKDGNVRLRMGMCS